MATDLHHAIHPDVIEKADKLAEDLCAKMKCDSVYISLANDERLFPFGISEPGTNNVADRILLAKDTICSVTSQRNEMVSLPDARTVEGLKDRGIVKSGGIVGYMGLPIRDEAGHSIGAICATTTTPRAWTEIDRMMLFSAASETQAMLATAGLKHENQVLSDALGEYDEIIGAIAKHADALISIHAKAGTLIFATNALLHRMDPCELEKQVNRALTMTKRPGFPSLQEPKLRWNGRGDEGSLRPTMRSHSGALTFVKWEPSGEDGS
ncbi:MAG: GAF domain-containing protein [Pseudomonadota bacterium]